MYRQVGTCATHSAVARCTCTGTSPRPPLRALTTASLYTCIDAGRQGPATLQPSPGSRTPVQSFSNGQNVRSTARLLCGSFAAMHVTCTSVHSSDLRLRMLDVVVTGRRSLAAALRLFPSFMNCSSRWAGCIYVGAHRNRWSRKSGYGRWCGTRACSRPPEKRTRWKTASLSCRCGRH